MMGELGGRGFILGPLGEVLREGLRVLINSRGFPYLGGSQCKPQNLL